MCDRLAGRILTGECVPAACIDRRRKDSGSETSKHVWWTIETDTVGFMIHCIQAPLPPTTADCHRLPPTIPMAWETSTYPRVMTTKISLNIHPDNGLLLDSTNICTWTNGDFAWDLWIRHKIFIYYLFHPIIDDNGMQACLSPLRESCRLSLLNYI